MPGPGSFRYLSSTDVEALRLGPRELADTVQAAFRALGTGQAESVPKSGFRISASGFFHAMPGRYDT